MAGESGTGVKQDALVGVLIVAALIVMYIAYKNFHVFAEAWRWIRFAELYVFQFIPAFNMPFLGEVNFEKAVHFLSIVTPYGIDLDVMTKFDTIYAPWIAIPMGIFLLYWAKKIGSGTSEIGKVENMESIFERFSHIYPYLQEIYQNNPQKKPLRYDRKSKESYRWGKAMSGYQFAIMKPPLGLERQAKKNGSYNRAIYAGPDDFDMDLAERAFENQLGPRWEGEDALSEQEQVVFRFLKDRLPTDSERTADFVRKCWSFTKKVVFKKKAIPEKISSKNLTEKEINLVMAMLEKYRDLFETILSSEDDKLIAKKFKKKGIKVKNRVELLAYIKSNERLIEIGENADKYFTSYFEDVIADEVMSGHNYVRCGLMSLNQAACDGGRISLEEIKSAVKSKDRTLWYALKCAGRQVAFAEVAGIHAHWLFEKDKGRRVSYPCVQEAVEALRLELRLDLEDD